MYILLFSRGLPTNTDPLNGIFEFDQAKAIQKWGKFKVIYLALDLRSIRKRRRFGVFEMEKDGISIVSISVPIGPIYYRLFNWIGRCLTVYAYKKIHRKFGKPSLVHAHFTVYGGIASILKTKFDVPLVFTEHSSLVTKDIISESTKYWVSKSYQHADKIISVSEALASNIKKKFGYSSFVVNNIVDTDSFDYIERKRKSLFQFVSVGNLVYGKGFDVLIKAFSLIKSDNVILKIIGDGPLRSELIDQVDKLGLNQRIKFLGRLHREQINIEFGETDCFVLASRGETFGVSYVEAMSSGLPVIATRCGGPEEFVTESTGILVPVDDFVALSIKMKEIMQKIDNYNRKWISNSIKMRYSPQIIASELQKTYNKLIDGGEK